MNSKKELERLDYIFKSMGKSKAALSSIFGISATAINRYLKNEIDIQNLMRKLSILGFSIDWLLTGDGSHLLKKLSIEDLEDFHNQYNHYEYNDRIRDWVNKYYGSIAEFELQRDIDSNKLRDVLLRGLPVSFRLQKKIRNAGCNIKWAISGNGSPFEDNVKGRELKRRYEK